MKKAAIGLATALVLSGCGQGDAAPTAARQSETAPAAATRTPEVPAVRTLEGEVITFNLLHQTSGPDENAIICIAPGDQGIALDAQMTIRDGATQEPLAVTKLGNGLPRKFLSTPGHMLCAFPFAAEVPQRASYELSLAGESMVVMGSDTAPIEWDRKVS